MFSEFYGRQYLKPIFSHPPAPNTIKFSNLDPNGFFKKWYTCHVYVIYMSCIYVNQNVWTQIVPSPLSDNMSKGPILWAKTCHSHVFQTPILHMQCITLKDRHIYCILHNLTRRRSLTHLSERDAQTMWMQSGIVSFWCRQVVTTLTPCVVTLPAEMYYLSNNTYIRLLPETNHAIKTADSSTDITYYIPVR